MNEHKRLKQFCVRQRTKISTMKDVSLVHRGCSQLRKCTRSLFQSTLRGLLRNLYLVFGCERKQM